MLLYGDFQPHMRTQYTAQYNLTIQRELARDIVLQFGYVGSQGHRLLASHDINAANPQTCLDLYNISQYYLNQNGGVPDALSNAYACGPFLEDNQFLHAGKQHSDRVHAAHAVWFHRTVSDRGTRHSTWLACVRIPRPTATPIDWRRLSAGRRPGLHQIFAEDTIAASAYNSFQASLEKRFSHGLQLQAAYTFSKSLDWASSFEETVNPFNYKASRALSLFNSAQRFVINYVWDIPVRKYSGFAGKVLDDWQLSGIIQFQSGFPIRIQTQDDNELISSLFFLGAGAPQLSGPAADPESEDEWRPLSQRRSVLRSDARHIRHNAAFHLLRSGRKRVGHYGLKEDCAIGVEILPVPRRHLQSVQQDAVREPGRQLQQHDLRPGAAGSRSAPGAVCFEVLLLAESV